MSVPSNDKPERIKLGRKVAALTNAYLNAEQALVLIMTQLQSGLGDEAATCGIIDRALPALRRELPALVEMIAEIYAKNFEIEDLRALASFFEAPLGRKLMAKQADVTAEALRAGQEWGAKVTARLLRETALSSGGMNAH